MRPTGHWHLVGPALDKRPNLGLPVGKVAFRGTISLAILISIATYVGELCKEGEYLLRLMKPRETAFVSINEVWPAWL